MFDQNHSRRTTCSTLVDDFRSVNPNDTSHLEFETLPWQEGPTQNGADVLYVQREPQDQTVLARLRDFSGTDTSGSVTTLARRSRCGVQVADGTGNGSLADV